MTLFIIHRVEESKLCLRAGASIVGAKYRFLLRYEAAFEELNLFWLQMVVDWPLGTMEQDEYYRKTSASWFAYWTESFVPVSFPRRSATPHFISAGVKNASMQSGTWILLPAFSNRFSRR